MLAALYQRQDYAQYTGKPETITLKLKTNDGSHLSYRNQELEK